jgi:amino acid permease
MEEKVNEPEESATLLATVEEALPEHLLDHHAGVLGTVVNMLCNIMGGAVLVLATAINNASLVPGILIIVVMGVLSLATMVMLVHAAENHRLFSYRTLLAATTHPRIGFGFEVCLLLYTFGVLVEYGTIICNSMPAVASDFFGIKSGILSEGWFWLLLACVPFMILTSLKQLTELRWSSFVGFATIAYIEVVVAVRFFGGSYREANNASLVDRNVTVVGLTMKFFQAIPVLSLAFSCHYNVPFYYRELKVRTVQEFYRVLWLLHPFLITVYVLTGVFGYLTFGSQRIQQTKGNVVNAFHSDDAVVNAGRLGLFFHFCTAFPVVAMACRNCLNSLMVGRTTRRQVVYIAEAMVLVSAAAMIAAVVPGVGVVVEVIGSLFGVAIVFIIPSTVYIFTFRKEKAVASARGLSTRQQEPQHSTMGPGQAVQEGEIPELLRVGFDSPTFGTVPRVSFLFYLAHVLVVVGAVCAVISFTVTIVNIANGTD